MPAENPSLFARAIEEHLELKQRNARLDRVMPIDHYKGDDPFANNPLFKTENQARREEVPNGAEPLGEERTRETADVIEDSGFWIAEGPPEFDWGD